MWNSIPTVNGATADIVLGEPNHHELVCKWLPESNASVFGNTGEIYSDGTRLFIADSNSGRVLIYNTVPTASGTAADVVVGQPNMTSSVLGTTASQMNRLWAVYSDGTRLFVGDDERVLIWNTIPTQNGAAANRVLGQTDFTSHGCDGSPNYAVTASSLCGPNSIRMYGGKLYACGPQ